MDDLAEQLTTTLVSHASDVLSIADARVMILVESSSGRRFWGANGGLRAEFIRDGRIEYRPGRTIEVGPSVGSAQSISVPPVDASLRSSDRLLSNGSSRFASGVESASFSETRSNGACDADSLHPLLFGFPPASATMPFPRDDDGDAPYDPSKPSREDGGRGGPLDEAERFLIEGELERFKRLGKLRYRWIDSSRSFLVVRRDEVTRDDVIVKISSVDELNSLFSGSSRLL